jgi:hypothetical protein
MYYSLTADHGIRAVSAYSNSVIARSSSARVFLRCMFLAMGRYPYPNSATKLFIHTCRIYCELKQDIGLNGKIIPLL